MAKRTVGLGRDVRAVLRTRSGSERVLVSFESRVRGRWVPGLVSNVDINGARALLAALEAFLADAHGGQAI